MIRVLFMITIVSFLGCQRPVANERMTPESVSAVPLPTNEQKDEIFRLLDEGAGVVVMDIETGEVTAVK